MKAPPVFDPEEDSYESWKNELGMWEVFTDAASNKRGPIVYMQLRGKAKDAVRSLTPAELHVEDGLKIITDKLDKIFLKDANTGAFHAFQKFYEYRRKVVILLKPLLLVMNIYTAN